MLGRSYVGIEQEIEYLEISKARRQLLDDKREEWSKKIPDLRIHRMADA
jgi:DNA modification methylase